MAERKPMRRRRIKGEPWVWLSGGAVATGIVMIVWMLALLVVEGTAAFWPYDIEAYVLGEARYHVHHAEDGPVWISQDEKLLVVPGAGRAWRRVDGSPAGGAVANPRRATAADFREHRSLFEGAGREWRLRAPTGATLKERDGRATSPNEFLSSPERYRRIYEPDRGDFESRVVIEDSVHGAVWLPEDNGQLLVEAEWRDLSGNAMPLDFKTPRAATIADFRDLPDLFKGSHWLLADPNGQVVQDEAGNPVRAPEYIENTDGFASPWGYLDEQGEKVPVETLLGDDRLRDHKLVVGAVRGRRDMDIRALPPNPDGTPVKPYQLDETPIEVLVRQGNQGPTLYNDAAYFRWVRTELRDIDGMKRFNTGAYKDVVLARAPLPGATMIERLDKGVLIGYVTGVTVGDKQVADLEQDGREGVWEVFLREQARMREQYLHRYSLEKHDIGLVNARLKSMEDELKRIRYDHRDSRVVAELIGDLEGTFAAWQALEPLPDPERAPDEHARLAAAWLEKLSPLLEKWLKSVEEHGVNESEHRALQKASETTLERGRVQAEEFSPLRAEVRRLQHEEHNATYTFATSDGRTATLELFEVVRAFRPNELGLAGKLGVYVDRVWEYLSDDPRESNSEGGIWPVILGTLIMTLLMCFAVVPFGVICALYLREYAKQGTLVSAVRISVNNLAGVPSIVFGIFGLGFFCVVVGGTIDDLFFPEMQPAPIFAGGNILWAALTLALLTVPVVVVSTEEALSAVPSSQREASLACGASKFQTIWRVILPQAMPGVLTGTILAMARGAGEVAPLMLVGAVKSAPLPPVDAVPPFVHLERKFMHLGFHVYDVGFQSPNVDNTKPLVFATALVLIALVAVLNVFAITLRNKLRKKLATSAV